MISWESFTAYWVDLISSAYSAQGQPAILSFNLTQVLPPIQFLIYTYQTNIWFNPAYFLLQSIVFNTSNGPQTISRLDHVSLLKAVESIMHNRYWNGAVGLPALPWC
jgi:hypothetical protein